MSGRNKLRSELISAIVTEEGVLRPPFGPALARAIATAIAARDDLPTADAAGVAG